MMVSQKGQEFVGMEYEKIKKNYSIWICLNRPECDIVKTKVELESNNKNKLKFSSLSNGIYILVSKKKPPETKEYYIHRFLWTLFTDSLDGEERIKRLQEEFNIPLYLKEEVIQMCNLSEGIYEKGYASGAERGRSEGRSEGITIGEERGRNEGITIGEERGINLMIQNMLKSGLGIEEISKIAQKSVEEIRKIAVV